MLYVKIIAAVAILGGLSGGAFYLKYLIGENAVLESTIVAERASLKNFADEVTDDINGYKTAMAVLMDGYKRADNEQNRLEKLLAKHDLGALAKSKPGMVARRINAGTARMFNAIESASGNTESARASSIAEAKTNTQ